MKRNLSYLEKVVKKNPRYADAYFEIEYSNGHLGLYTEAVEPYKQAIRIKPDDAGAHSNLGVAYLSVGSKGFALDEYKVLKGLNKNLANELFNKIY